MKTGIRGATAIPETRVIRELQTARAPCKDRAEDRAETDPMEGIHPERRDLRELKDQSLSAPITAEEGRVLAGPDQKERALVRDSEAE